MQSCVLVFGPFVGDFISEITTFRPYVRWAQEVVAHKRSIVNTHSNRKFMYEDFDVFLPVDQDLTEDVDGQQGRVHKLLARKEYIELKEDLKGYVCDKYGTLKKDCRQISLPYSDTMPQPISANQMILEPIDIGQVHKKGHMLIIARDGDEANWLESALSHRYDVKTIIDGDEDKSDELKADPALVLKTITEPKYVVSSDPRWLTVALTQGVPSFGFGAGLARVKASQSIGPNTAKCVAAIVPDSESNKKKIINQLDWFVDKNEGWAR